MTGTAVSVVGMGEEGGGGRGDIAEERGWVIGLGRRGEGVFRERRGEGEIKNGGGLG